MMAAQPHNFADAETVMFSAALKKISSRTASEDQTKLFNTQVQNALRLLENPLEHSAEATALEVTLALILTLENELKLEISDPSLKKHDSDVAKKLRPLVEKYLEAGI